MSVLLSALKKASPAGLLFQWRKLERHDALTAVSASEAVLPASEMAAARAEISKFQRVLGKKTLENEILKEAVESAAEKVVFALALVSRKRPVKTVCRTMGLARSHVRNLLGRDDDWTDGRSHRTPCDDWELLAELRQKIAQLPSYGYRRACALVNRQRKARGAARVNAKRVYRVMAGAGLLLPKAARMRQSARTHEGRVAVSRSELRWCSDGLEIKCDSSQPVTATLAKDCCDREVMAWRA